MMLCDVRKPSYCSFILSLYWFHQAHLCWTELSYPFFPTVHLCRTFLMMSLLILNSSTFMLVHFLHLLTHASFSLSVAALRQPQPSVLLRFPGWIFTNPLPTPGFTLQFCAKSLHLQLCLWWIHAWKWRSWISALPCHIPCSLSDPCSSSPNLVVFFVKNPPRSLHLLLYNPVSTALQSCIIKHLTCDSLFEDPPCLH